jgi:hypothetical protein
MLLKNIFCEKAPMKNKLLFIWLSFLGLGLIGFWSLNKFVQSKFTAKRSKQNPKSKFTQNM